MNTIFGFGYEVYLINIAIAILTFYSLRWILKKLISRQSERNLITWIGTIILTPLIYIFGVLLILIILMYEPDRNFEQKRWFEHPELRYEMREDIIENEIRIGKTKSQIIDLIGKPNKEDIAGEWNYDLGMSGNGFGWQFNNLILTFKNAKVINNEIVEIKE